MVSYPVAAHGARSGGQRRGGEGGDEMDKKKERTSWTRAEDEVIVQGVAELGHKWYEIARRLPGRTDHAIRNRWSRLQSIMSVSASLHAASAPGIARLPAAAATLSEECASLVAHGGSAPRSDLTRSAAAAAPMLPGAQQAETVGTHLSNYAAPSDEHPFSRPGAMHLGATLSTSSVTAAPSDEVPR